MTTQEKVVKAVLDGKISKTEMDIVLTAMKISYMDGKIAEKEEREFERFCSVVPAIDYD